MNWDTIIAFIPLTVLIIGALATKRIAEMMILASFLGTVFLYGRNFFSGYIDMIYQTLSNSSYQFVLIILVGFGGMIKLFQESGALLGFGNLVHKFARGQKMPLIISWIMALIMFVDDYLSTLAVSFSMKDITDKNGIPREHLAFQSNSVAACFCVLIPFSSWTAFNVGLISEQGLGYSDYISALPYMFYPILTVALCILLDLHMFPKMGMLKKAYGRTNAGGPAFVQESVDASIVSIDLPENHKPSSAANALVPIAVLVAVVLIYDNDLVHGILAAVAVQAVMYIGGKIMTLSDFMRFFFDGAKSMVSLAVVICFAFMLSAANKELGLFDIIIGGVGSTVPPSLLPVMVFLVVAFTTFATSGYWMVQIISIPIFIPLAFSMGINPAIILAAIMSGVTLGCNLCFYSDPVFMTSASTEISNLKIVKTTLPYAMTAAAFAAAGYLALGFIA